MWHCCIIAKAHFHEFNFFVMLMFSELISSPSGGTLARVHGLHSGLCSKLY